MATVQIQNYTTTCRTDKLNSTDKGANSLRLTQDASGRVTGTAATNAIAFSENSELTAILNWEPDLAYFAIETVVTVGGVMEHNVLNRTDGVYEWFKDTVSQGVPTLIPNSAEKLTLNYQRIFGDSAETVDGYSNPILHLVQHRPLSQSEINTRYDEAVLTTATYTVDQYGNKITDLNGDYIITSYGLAPRS